MNYLGEFEQYAKNGAVDKWCSLYDTMCTYSFFFTQDPQDFLTSARTLLQSHCDCSTHMEVLQRVQDYVLHCWNHAFTPSRVSRFCMFIINSNNHELKIQAHPLVVKALARDLVLEGRELIVKNWIDEYDNVIQNKIISQALPSAPQPHSVRKM